MSGGGGGGQHTEAGWRGKRGSVVHTGLHRERRQGGFVELPGPQLVAPEWAAVCPAGPKAAQEGQSLGHRGQTCRPTRPVINGGTGTRVTRTTGTESPVTQRPDCFRLFLI